MKKLIGWVLITISGWLLGSNVWQALENERERAAHPIKTFFSGGSNLKPAYDFWPPSTGFEVAVLVALLVGCFMAFSGNPETEEIRRSPGEISY